MKKGKRILINSFEGRLTVTRKEVGFTQDEMGEKLGILGSSYGKYEQGKAFPNAERLMDICDILDVSPNYLLSGQESPLDKKLSLVISEYPEERRELLVTLFYIFTLLFK